MAKVGLVDCVGFLVEGTSACVLVDEVGPCLSGGRSTSGGVFSGVCGLIIILGSLSANGWGCVPVLLVVWHRVSSTAACWSLSGLGLGAEMEISGRFSPFDIMWSWEVSCGPVS